MKVSFVAVLSLAVCLAFSGGIQAAQEEKADKAEKAGKSERAGRHGGARGEGRWMLGVSAWTFHKDTLFEAIDNAKELGLHYIELLPMHKMKLSPEQKDVEFNEGVSQEVFDKVKAKLKAADIQAISCYCAGQFGKDEAATRKGFEFVKKLGAGTIVAEPDPASMKMVDKLANEFEINVAIHNHPKRPESKYWSPDAVLEAIKGCSKRVGACADTGHWVRSGLDPLECLKKLEGHVLACHFKDLNEKTKDAHDVPWGTGVGKAGEMLKELHRQGFRGPIMIEYEYNWGKAMPEIKQCVEFFRRTMRDLRGSNHPRPDAGKDAEKK